MHIRIVTLPFLAFLCLLSCKNEPKAADKGSDKPKPDTILVKSVPTEGAVPYTITEGVVYWVGRKATGAEHNGTIACSSGEVLVNQGQILSGSVELDMQSVSVLDIKDGGEKRELESHLKDADFFDVKKFPKGVFKIEEVLPSNLPEFNAVLSGQLTLKGKTNPVNVPVKLTFSGDELNAESMAFMINRTEWGINFQSGILGTAKDKLIDDGVRLALQVKAKKK